MQGLPAQTNTECEGAAELIVAHGRVYVPVEAGLAWFRAPLWTTYTSPLMLRHIYASQTATQSTATAAYHTVLSWIPEMLPSLVVHTDAESGRQTEPALVSGQGLVRYTEKKTFSVRC